MTDSTIAYLGLILAVFGIPFTFFVSRYFANRKKIDWYYRERKVLDPVGGEFPSNVQIFFGGVEVPQLSEWSVGFWNSGNQSVTASDIATAVELCFANCRILQVSEVSVSREGIVASAAISDDSTNTLSFNFLDPGDGLALTVYTEGDPTSGDQFDLSISTTIIGVPKGPKLISRLRNYDVAQTIAGLITGFIAVALPLAFLYFGWTEAHAIGIRENVSLFEAAMMQNSEPNANASPLLLIGFILSVLYLPIGTLMIWNAFKGYFSTIPNNVRQLAKDRPFHKIRNPVKRTIVESLYRFMELTRFP